MAQRKEVKPIMPKVSTDTLTFDAAGNSACFIVFSRGKYHYFPVIIDKFDTKNIPPILRFGKAPPYIMEGIVRVHRKLYWVTPNDILRGIVRTSQIYTPVNEDESRTNRFAASASIANLEELEGAIDPGTQALADSAFEEQMGALSDIEAAKEEWESTGNP